MLTPHSNDIPDPSSLPPITQEQLNAILEKHKIFNSGKIGGARAVLQYKNLSGLNFHRCDLSGADLTASTLIGADLSYSNLKGSCFFACDLRNADLSQSDLTRADLRGAYLVGADLTGANLTNADMREGKIMTKSQKGFLVDRKRSGGDGALTVLTGAKLSGANLTKVRANGVDFTDTDLSGAQLHDATFKGATFINANLSDSDFTGADISQCDMSDSVLSGTIMRNTENYGLKTEGSISEHDMGKKLEDDNHSLEDLLQKHSLWISTAGKSGQQLDLSGYDLRGIKHLREIPLTAVRASRSSLINLDLSKASIQSANFDHSDFRDCILNYADLRGSSFKNVRFTRSIIRKANFSPLEFKNRQQIKRTDLTGADLKFCDLRYSDLRDCILINADLTNTDFTGADLRRADLSGAKTSGAIFNEAQMQDIIIDSHSS